MKKNNPQYLKLFASCVPVKGAKQSTICDLERNKVDIIPNDLFEIIEELEGKSLPEIFAEYGEENEEVLQSYFDFLISKDYAFKTNTPELFPKLNAEYQTPEIITNAIIDIDTNSSHNFNIIARSLDELGCKDLQIRIFKEEKLSSLTKMLLEFKRTTLKSIELIIKYYEGLEKEELQTLSKSFPRIYQIVIHSSPCNQQWIGQNKSISTYGNIIFTEQKITDASHCGFIAPNNFSINTETYIESKNHNSCLNKKIAIDVDGNIKNCPSMNTSYGNIKNMSLEEIAKKWHFQKVWKVKKDDIAICKDCEFRYICTDCRAYTERDEPLGKPSKCNYDPYTATWYK